MTELQTEKPEAFDAVVIGAGFAGLYMLHKLRSVGLSVRVVEAGSGIGGTWYWNRYPGARCDVESMEYSYQFSDELQQEWEWSERYAAQPEILRYLNHVADRFDLRRDIQLETRVASAHFDESKNEWQIETDRGRFVAPHCIMATGCLSSSHNPEIDGRETFEGATYHTGHWPHEGVDFTGKRVGVIGTGSSGVQAIPLIAEEAADLTVFQRTATYAAPAHNHPLDSTYQRDVKSRYRAFREASRQTHLGFGSDYPSADDAGLGVSDEDRNARFEEYWQRGGLFFMGSYTDVLLDHEVNESAAEFVRGKIRSRVGDPELAKRLSPKQVLGCKRLCADTRYYEAFNRQNVHLVDVSETPIESFTRKGLMVGGAEYELDAVVFATGFDAMTGSLDRIDIRGKGGQRLKEKWSEGPRTYIGLGIVGFPNFFVITGPGSPSVLTNMVPAIEQHVNWIADCITHMRDEGLRCIEATEPAEEEWVQHVNDVASFTLFPQCNSWYLGANVPGKPRVFMPYVSFSLYVAKCDEVAANGYEGFALK
ncbi:MAG: NAD(P)/FAD-dependent oxidoreductase [Candidatus Binatia bacterium]|nr:NAD(P)/FAD-dependent oxidoreductase [Candidatus Binatia bacterium]